MKISEIFNLNKSQAELDFVNIDINEDTPLFLDPFFLSQKNDHWSTEATKNIRSFFQEVVDLIRNNDENQAKELFNFLHEPNSTCLGMSRGNPSGKGVGTEDTNKIYDSLLTSRAIQSGLIQDIEDNILFVDNFGKDKLSDMTTNIITKNLIEYTQNQCKLYNIPLSQSVSSGFYWDRSLKHWTSDYTEMLVINDRKILLVPKGIVSFCKGYTPERYYRHFILDFLQNENLRIKSSLVQKRKNGVQYVTKKSLQEQHPFSKDFLRQFSTNYPGVLDQFKNEVQIDSLKNNEITDIRIDVIKKVLLEKLDEIPSGNENASKFHNLTISILHLLFYPHLINPIKEREIHEGRKRVDITFDNAAETGIFLRLHQVMNIPCQYIFIECKNYSTDIANPELDQISGRFSVNKGKVGFIVCRTFDNFNLFMKRCKDTYTDGRGLIIPIVDADLKYLLENFKEGENQSLEKFISDRIREITIN